MAQNSLKPREKYYKISNYSMKCRMYPNKSSRQKIDRMINGVGKAYNNFLYEAYHGYCTIERKDDDGNVYHDIDFKKAVKEENLHKIQAMHPDSSEDVIYAASLSGRNGIFAKNLQSAMSHKVVYKTNKLGIKHKTHDRNPRTGKNGTLFPYSLELSQPDYFSKKNPNHSFYYQLAATSIFTKDNPNVIYISSKKYGTVKIRGWNRKIRFDESGEVDFLDYLKSDPNKRIGVFIKKDNIGNYYIVFSLTNIYKPMKECSESLPVGIDVGIKDVAILSDGKKYENRRFKKESLCRIKKLNKQLSRKEGFANIKWRKKYSKENSITPSKGYLYVQTRLAEIQKRIANKRETYYHQISADIVKNHTEIGIETLNVTDMFQNKRLAKELEDAAMSSLLGMIRYKSGWYGRQLHEVGQYQPSSKRCSSCGYILPELSLSVRSWVCPECGSYHDRDVNAAKNILYFTTKN